MTDWRWVGHAAAIAIHLEQLAEHGGGEGVRDEGLLISALARAQNAAAYGTPDAASLAAAYAYGIAQNHPFIDGNKRTAWVVARLFLAKNDFQIVFRKADATVRMMALAAGEIDEEHFACWLRERFVEPV